MIKKTTVNPSFREDPVLISARLERRRPCAGVDTMRVRLSHLGSLISFDEAYDRAAAVYGPCAAKKERQGNIEYVVFAPFEAKPHTITLSF